MAADIQFRIGAELSEIKGALASLKRDFQQVGQSAQQAGGGRSMAGIESGAQRAANAVKALVAAFAALAALRGVIQAADELNTLNARLRLVTRSTEEFNVAQAALFELAQRTRSSLGETISLYARIAQATKDAGVGQAVLLGVVETINQAVQLSGSSAQAAEAALVQLGQGLASGTLRGEELNSILEQTPALADAIAKGMGITRGELRKYGEEGKLTAESVITALQKQRDEVAQQFQQLPLTVGQAITKIKNASLSLVGAFDRASRTTAGLAGALDSLAKKLSSNEMLSAVIEISSTWGTAFSQMAKDVNNLNSEFDGLAEFIYTAFRDLPVNLRALLQIAVIFFASSIDKMVTDARFLKEAFLAIFSDDTIDAAIERRRRAIKIINDAAEGARDDALADRDAAIAAAKAAAEAAVQARAAALAKANADQENANFTGKKKPGLGGVASLLDLTKDAALRGVREIEYLYETAKVSLQDYLARRTELQLEAINSEIALERQRISKSSNPDERNKAATRVAILERDKTDIITQAERDRERLQREQADKLVEIRATQLDHEGKLFEAAQLRLQLQYRDTIARLKADGNTEGVSLVEKIIDTEAARAKFADLKQQADRILSDLQTTAESLNNQRDLGAIPGATAEAQTRDARNAAIEQLSKLNIEMRALAETTNDPRIIEGANAITAALQRLAIEGATGIDAAVISLRSSLTNLQNNFAQLSVDAGVSALENFFTNIATGSMTAGEALRQFALDFARSMAQIAARAIATYAVLQLLEAVFPGAGKLVAGSARAGIFHRGGMVGGAAPSRAVSPLAFAGAPRFHSGGMVGIKPGEVPAILQTGEEVLARNDPRNAANGGASQGGGYRIVNVLDPGLVSNFLESAAGERVVMNVIGRNPSQVRQLIGS